VAPLLLRRASDDPDPGARAEMVELAERMFQEITSFERSVTAQDLRPSGELRVTTSDVLLRHLLSEVFVAFRRAYPQIILNIVVSNQRLDLSLCGPVCPPRFGIG